MNAAFNLRPTNIKQGARIAPSKGDILLEASRLWNEFDDADIKTRGALLGIEITTYDNVVDG